MDLALTEADKTVMQGFRWRDRTGQMHDPRDMATRHLFFTLRMIWNHTVPGCPLPGGRYTFGPTYSADYMRKAVYRLTQELAIRTDLDAESQLQLQHMLNWLKRPQVT